MSYNVRTQTPNYYVSTARVKRAHVQANINGTRTLHRHLSIIAYWSRGGNFCLKSDGYKLKPSPESSPVYIGITPASFRFSPLSCFYRLFPLSKCSVYRNNTAIITCLVNRALSYDVCTQTPNNDFSTARVKRALLPAYML